MRRLEKLVIPIIEDYKIADIPVNPLCQHNDQYHVNAEYYRHVDRSILTSFCYSDCITFKVLGYDLNISYKTLRYLAVLLMDHHK